MKIALVSTGLGRVLRGFESFTESLFRNLRSQTPDIDVTLFQGGGRKGERRNIIPNLHRAWTDRWIGPAGANLLEKRSFALWMYPLLRKANYDIVHYNELCFGSALFHLRRLFGGNYRLLYCNGAPSPPVHYHHRCDYVQLLTGPMYEEAVSYGITARRLFFIPYGVDGRQFSPAARAWRNEIRSQLGIPEDAAVVLTVAALGRRHKRIDHLLRELSRMQANTWLLAAGHRTDETASLEREADRLLPSRWKFLSWPHEQMDRLYGASDVFVLASLTEGLPIASIEAMMSGLPVVLHDAPLFRWAADGEQVRHVNMSASGELSRAVEEALRNGSGSKGEASAKRFSWGSLIPDYVRMYEQIFHENSLTE